MSGIIFSLRSFANHQRDHKGDDCTAGIIDCGANEIERLEREHDEYVVRANANVCDLNRDIDRLRDDLGAALVRENNLRTENERTQAMKGLEGRLARLLVSGDMGQRFILSDSSAANIAAIAREWVRSDNQQTEEKK